MLRLLELYVLWAVGELPEKNAASLDQMTPKLQQAFNATGTWQELIAGQMEFTDEVPAALRGMWQRNLAKADERRERLDPEEWARHVVDTNFV